MDETYFKTNVGSKGVKLTDSHYRLCESVSDNIVVTTLAFAVPSYAHQETSARLR